MANIQVYTKGYCPYCTQTKSTLKKYGLSFSEIDVTRNRVKETEMRTKSGRTSVPQIFIDDIHIGGNDDLNAAVRSGQLNEIINLASTK